MLYYIEWKEVYVCIQPQHICEPLILGKIDFSMQILILACLCWPDSTWCIKTRSMYISISTNGTFLYDYDEFTLFEHNVYGGWMARWVLMAGWVLTAALAGAKCGERGGSYKRKVTLHYVYL